MTPEYRLDPLLRLRILAAALPGATVAVREISAPFESVWRIIEDLERFTPQYESAISRARFADGIARTRLAVTYESGQDENYDVRLARGWCLMQSPSVVVAFAASASQQSTVLGHLEHWRRRAGRPRFPAAKLERELFEIERLASSGT